MYIPEYDKSKIDHQTSEFFPSNVKFIKNNDGNSVKLKKIFCRIVFRTPVTNLRSDINGLDLYTVIRAKKALLLILNFLI